MGLIRHADLIDLIRNNNGPERRFPIRDEPRVVVLVEGMLASIRHLEGFGKRVGIVQAEHAVEAARGRFVVGVAAVVFAVGFVPRGGFADEEEEERHQGGDAGAYDAEAYFEAAPEDGGGDCPWELGG